MFSISTVASSTSTPTASASPPSVMMFIVWPAAHSRHAPTARRSGIVATTISALRQSRRNSSTISAGEQRPSSPSITRFRIAPATYCD